MCCDLHCISSLLLFYSCILLSVRYICICRLHFPSQACLFTYKWVRILSKPEKNANQNAMIVQVRPAVRCIIRLLLKVSEVRIPGRPVTGGRQFAVVRHIVCGSMRCHVSESKLSVPLPSCSGHSWLWHIVLSLRSCMKHVIEKVHFVSDRSSGLARGSVKKGRIDVGVGSTRHEA